MRRSLTVGRQLEPFVGKPHLMYMDWNTARDPDSALVSVVSLPIVLVDCIPNTQSSAVAIAFSIAEIPHGFKLEG
jgi:hypothetical protein